MKAEIRNPGCANELVPFARSFAQARCANNETALKENRWRKRRANRFLPF
jgi:hypothetical protein